MLTTANAMTYEVTATAGVTMLLFLIQLVTGTMFSWLLWIYSFATVLLGFIDNDVVGFKLSSDVQLRRMMTNLVSFIVSGLLLYVAAKFLIPDVDVTKLMSIIAGFQKLMKVYNYFGPLLHVFVYNCLHFCAINFIRFFVNAGYIVYMQEHEVLNLFQYAGIAYLIQAVLQFMPLDYSTFFYLHCGIVLAFFVVTLITDINFYRDHEPLSLVILSVRLISNTVLMSILWGISVGMLTLLDFPKNFEDATLSPRKGTEEIMKTFGTLLGMSLLVVTNCVVTMTLFSLLRTFVAAVHLVLKTLQYLVALARGD